MYPEDVAGEKGEVGGGGGGGGGGAVGERRVKRAEPSWFTTRLTLLADSPLFLAFAPSKEPGPELRPWHALWDKQAPMFEHLLLHRKSRQLYE